MAEKILVIGETGSGKTTSLETLNPEETFLIRVADKSLPFTGWKKLYHSYDKVTGKGNMLTTHNPDFIIKGMQVADGISSIKNIIIDDVQYMMSFEFMERAKESGWQKFTDIGQNAFNVFMLPDKLRKDLTVIFFCHSVDEGYDKKVTKIKTIGKMLDEKITVEGLFTIVLLSKTEDTSEGLKHWFITNSDGTTTAKSPRGMFEMKIPNNMQAVLDRIKEYDG